MCCKSHGMHLSKISNTLNSVGTISLGVSKPINISRPTKDRIDKKMEKSLISFLIYRPSNRREEEQRSEGRETYVQKYRQKGLTWENKDKKREKNYYVESQYRPQVKIHQSASKVGGGRGVVSKLQFSNDGQ